MRRVFYTGSDGGDGSIGVEFYDSQECIDLLEEALPEDYRGEGGGWFDVEGEITGINIQTMNDVRQHVSWMTDEDE